jgi:GxxExxY protein
MPKGDALPDDAYPLSGLTKRIIAAAVEVHRAMGPGYVEKIYENALVLELESRGHKVDRQITVDVAYRGKLVGQHRIDLLVDDLVVLELKSVEALANAHKAQLRSSLKAAGKRIGLLMNFNQETLTSGVKRVIN